MHGDVHQLFELPLPQKQEPMIPAILIKGMKNYLKITTILLPHVRAEVHQVKKRKNL